MSLSVCKDDKQGDCSVSILVQQKIKKKMKINFRSWERIRNWQKNMSSKTGTGEEKCKTKRISVISPDLLNEQKSLHTRKNERQKVNEQRNV